jgi:sugar phosphate isomerase/epimerase
MEPILSRSKTIETSPDIDAPLVDASLSTMWADHGGSPLDEFFGAGSRMGFAKFELNHKITSAMINQAHLGAVDIIAIHEPCPADISVETLKSRDWLVSSPNEDCRVQGVKAVKRSIELADELSVPTVVMHCGQVSGDTEPEGKLRQLYAAGLVDSAEYLEIKSGMEERRRRLAGPCLESVCRSLKELLGFAGRHGVRLGLENRYHHFDMPTPDEMAALLELGSSDLLGFIYDIGHATAMDRLKFYRNGSWLERFGRRIFGCHLHDVSGVSDHLAPGLGDVDFNFPAGFLPADSFRTLEVTRSNTPQQIRTGLVNLLETGCIHLKQ